MSTLCLVHYDWWFITLLFPTPPELRVPLDRACSEDDVCQDDNARCQAGYCVCERTHYSLNGACGECQSVLLHLDYYCNRNAYFAEVLSQTPIPIDQTPIPFNFENNYRNIYQVRF